MELWFAAFVIFVVWLWGFLFGFASGSSHGKVNAYEEVYGPEGGEADE